MKKEIKVLFVCLGNICRSPAAEGILRHLSKDDREVNINIASCGIGDWHLGKLPDARMRAASLLRGVSLTSKAQAFEKSFFDKYDYIMVADKEILRDLKHYAQTDEQKSKILLMTEYADLYKRQEVPDPYYGGERGFENVLDMLENSCKGLLEHIKKG
ncbi:MAG: low molecular weight phosphotyrosine protein phosphatase [Parachlamydiaceae bacterium]|nr:low molecular weight phosphotyrosine protein phosphatase [Parachlamydiaceae bacterium]